jgi:hypothetical protein
MTLEEENEYYRFVFAWMMCRLQRNKTVYAIAKDVLKKDFNSGWNPQQRKEIIKQALKIIEENDQAR